MNKKITLFFTTLIVAVLCFTVTAYAGTSIDSATRVYAGHDYNVNIEYDNTEYYYYFIPTVSGTYSFYSTGNLDTYGTIYDSNYSVIKTSDDDGSDSNFLIKQNLTKGTVYYFSARTYGYTPGNFNVHFRLVSAVKNISKSTIAFTSNKKHIYTGNAKKPAVVVKYGGKKLVKGRDYTVSYKNNKNAGKATVIIKGKGNYTGTKKKNFTIGKKTIKKVIMRDVTYNGKSKVPAVMYKKKQKYTYDGEVYYETVERSYKKGRDYTVKVKGPHKQVGTYTAIVKFKGNYKGTVKKKYIIRPRAVSKVSTKPKTTSSIYVRWNKVKNVTGYKVYRYNGSSYKLYLTTSKNSCIIKRPKNSTEQTVSFYIRTYKKIKGKNYYNHSYKDYYDSGRVKLSAPKITVVRTDFGEFKTYFDHADNYEFQRCKYKDFKCHEYTCDLSTWRGYTDAIRSYNLESGCTYYVRARIYYYTDSGRLVVGPWSKVKKVVAY